MSCVWCLQWGGAEVGSGVGVPCALSSAACDIFFFFFASPFHTNSSFNKKNTRAYKLPEWASQGGSCDIVVASRGECPPGGVRDANPGFKPMDTSPWV